MELKLVRDKTKEDTYMNMTIINMFKRGELRKDHPLQRKSGRWPNEARDGFIATVIKHEDVDSIKICEQIVDGKVILWLIDGIQRLTTIDGYRNGTFKLGPNLEEPIIHYQEARTDNEGKLLRDENGDLIYEIKEFDLRRKAYKDLPEKLKDEFNNFPIKVVKHLDCTDEEIGYHIRRYNRQTSMNVVETGVTYMDKVASYVKKIADGNRFFKDHGVYKEAEKNKSSVYRIVAESIMAMFHLDDWKKQTKQIGRYLNENSSEEEFYILDKNLNRLRLVISGKCEELFNSKNSFIWFALFERFKKYGVEDKKFIDFLNSLDELRFRSLPDFDGKSFDEVDNSKATKDKKIVSLKLSILECLLKGFIKAEDVKEYTAIELIQDCVDPGVTDEDIECYTEVFDDLIVNVDNSSNLLTNENKVSFIALVAYSFKIDTDLEDWIVDFFGRNNTYIPDQKRNYICMKKDLDEYLRRNKKLAV